MDRPPAKKFKLTRGTDAPASTTKASSKSSLLKTPRKKSTPKKKLTTRIDDKLIQSRLDAPEPEDSDDEEDNGFNRPRLVFKPDLDTSTSTYQEAEARLRGVKRPTMARPCKDIKCTMFFGVSEESRTKQSSEGLYQQVVTVPNPSSYSSLARWRNDIRLMWMAGKSLTIEDMSIKISIKDGVESETLQIYGPLETVALQKIYRLLNADDVVKAEFSCTLVYDAKPKYEDDTPYTRTLSEYNSWDFDTLPGYLESWAPDKATNDANEETRSDAILEADARAIFEETMRPTSMGLTTGTIAIRMRYQSLDLT
ncbi:hypothetical protein LTS10_001873 [Elasticomyces elasticus]|nr:hypothetical protein LTS10_001873 [Elasticomyces elasticus]